MHRAEKWCPIEFGTKDPRLCIQAETGMPHGFCSVLVPVYDARQESLTFLCGKRDTFQMEQEFLGLQPAGVSHQGTI